MADKKENEKDLGKQSKTRKRKQVVENNLVYEIMEEPETVQERVEEPVLASLQQEEQSVEKVEDEQLSCLDILWRQAFGELDEWVKRAEFRDKVFLEEAKKFTDSVQRNKGNLKTITNQFNREFTEWERTAREEFLMSTTSLQHFFPLRSYEEINARITDIQKKTVSVLTTPCQAITTNLSMEKYLEIVDQYIELRKKGRMQYIETVKQAGNLIYENQKGFIQLFARQIKTFVFPLNKYLDNTEELTKS